jgi:hypothetical protein
MKLLHLAKSRILSGKGIPFDPSGPPEETVQTCSTSRVYNIHYLASAERNKLDLGMNAVSLNNSNRGQKNIIHQYLQRRDPD